MQCSLQHVPTYSGCMVCTLTLVGVVEQLRGHNSHPRAVTPLATRTHCPHLATVFPIKMRPRTSHTVGMILAIESSWMFSIWYTCPQNGVVEFSVPFPASQVVLVRLPPKSVEFVLNIVSSVLKSLMQGSAAFVEQLVVGASIGPVIRLDTGRRALVAPKIRTVIKNVFLNPMYFGMNGNTINWRNETLGRK